MGKRTSRKSWYLLSYDIRDPKRLKRLHYQLKKHAFALQKSVFLVEEKEYHAALRIVKKYSKQNEDDVRLYPIVHPNAIWGAGLQSDAMEGLGLNCNGKHAETTSDDHSIITKTLKWLSKELKKCY